VNIIAQETGQRLSGIRRGPAAALTVVTSGLKSGSKTEREFTGGIVYIVSGLKTYVETGVPLVAATG